MGDPICFNAHSKLTPVFNSLMQITRMISQ